MTDGIAGESAASPFPSAGSAAARTGPAYQSPANRRAVFGNSAVEIDRGIWRMRISEDSYYASGLAAGNLLRAARYPAIEYFRRPHITVLFALMHAVIKRHFAKIHVPRRYLDELRGYADGSEIPYKTLFCMNFVFDILKKYGMHCSSVVVSRSGQMLVGRNTDLYPWIGRLAIKKLPSIVLDVATPGKVRYTHVAPGLFLGAFNGVNARGIAVMSHQIAATKEKAVAGNLSTTLLQRMLLEEATSMAHAESITRAYPVQRCIANLVVSGGEGESCIFEISPERVEILRQEAPYLCCVTHFQNADLAQLHRSKTPDSKRRLRLMNRLATKADAVPGDLIALLKNHDNGIAFGNSGSSPCNDGTYQSMVFDMAGRRIFLADGMSLPVSLSGAYREIQLHA